MKCLAAFISLATLVCLVDADGPRGSCVYLAYAEPGDTCSSFAFSHGTDVDSLEALNPGIDCTVAFEVPTQLCAQAYTPPCVAWVAATEPTCDYLLAQYHLTKVQFIENNDNVDGNCDLVIGKQYCATIDYCEVNPTVCCDFDPQSVYCSY